MGQQLIIVQSKHPRPGAPLEQTVDVRLDCIRVGFRSSPLSKCNGGARAAVSPSVVAASIPTMISSAKRGYVAQQAFKSPRPVPRHHDDRQRHSLNLSYRPPNSALALPVYNLPRRLRDRAAAAE